MNLINNQPYNLLFNNELILPHCGSQQSDEVLTMGHCKGGDGRKIYLHMTVFIDAVKLEKEEFSKRILIGWFRDEVGALAAASESILMESAILSSRRHLPTELVVCSEYRHEKTNRVIRKFKRATRVKVNKADRRVILTPGQWGKTWVRK